jgi:hypothetical protein
MTERKPNDGRPYYCALCGLGFGEFLACEEGDCELESDAEAWKRLKPNRSKQPTKSKSAGIAPSAAPSQPKDV